MGENYKFNAEKETKNVIDWVRNWFENESGKADGIILGISGGCDSMVAAKICREAVGGDKVLGVLMPNEYQPDISDSYRVCVTLGIKYCETDINGAYRGIIEQIPANLELTRASKINIAPRIRMTVVYAIGQTLNYRVCGTGNLSEKYVGYCTKWGDTACDFNPVAGFTKTEVRQIGDYLALPHDLTHKTPSDGLSGLSDEENMKITYEVLDNFIRTGRNPCGEEDAGIKEMLGRITEMNEKSMHKLNPPPYYKF